MGSLILCWQTWCVWIFSDWSNLCFFCAYVLNAKMRDLFFTILQESAAMYLDTVDYQHLHISQDEFLARLADAGIPEADMALKLMNNSTEQQQEHIQTPIEPVSSADVGIVKHSEQQQQRNDVDVLQDESPSTPERASSTSQIAQSDGASLLTTTLAVDEMIGSGLTPLAGGSSTPEVLIKRPQGRIRDDEQPQLKAQPGSSR